MCKNINNITLILNHFVPCNIEEVGGNQIETGDIIEHPKGRALANIWPWDKKRVGLRPLSGDCDLGRGAGQMIYISMSEAITYPIYSKATK